MQENLVEKMMAEVMKSLDANKAEKVTEKVELKPEVKKEASPLGVKPTAGVTEFVGTAFGDTIGLVIANVDPGLHEAMKIDKKYRSIGIIGARTGAGPHIMAADEAVKATNTEIVTIELARDTKGGAGHGNLIIFWRGRRFRCQESCRGYSSKC